MKKIITLYLFLLSLSCFSQEINFGKYDKNDTIIKYAYFTVCYDKQARESHWSSYFLCRNRLYGTVKRKYEFIPDSSLKNLCAELCSYKVMNYDRGHLTCAKDMSFDEKAMEQSFFLTNVCPQWFSFNRGTWKYLEMYTRKQAEYCDTIKVISGVIFGSQMTSCDKPIPIPSYFWKILVVDGKYRYFIFPNSECNPDFTKYEVGKEDFDKIWSKSSNY